MITRMSTFGQFVSQATTVSQEYDKLTRLLQQAGSGKRLLHSFEDPVLADQISSKYDFVNTLQGYSDNGLIAQSRASIVNASAQGASNLVSQISVLLKEAQDGTRSDSDRTNIANQLKGYLTSLTSLANAQDANGQYVFSGSNPTVAAYALVTGNYQYQGSDESFINIAPGISTVYGEDGGKIFGNIYQGNGMFTVAAGSGNTGTAWAAPGSVANPSAYVADTYTVSFATYNNKLVYRVVGATSGQVVPAPPDIFPSQAPEYKSGENISFNGIKIEITGQPSATDTFTIQPSTTKNIFNTLQDTVTLLKTKVTDRAQFDQSMSQTVASFEQIAKHIAEYQGNAGARTSAINSQVSSNKAVMTNQLATLSDLENANVAEVYSALSQQALALQATQAGYLKMQEVLSKLLQLPF